MLAGAKRGRGHWLLGPPAMRLMMIFPLLALPTILHKFQCRRCVTIKRTCLRVTVISRCYVGKVESLNRAKSKTAPGRVARNDMDAHADARCAGSNWQVVEWLDQACEVAPFLEMCDPVNKIPLAKCTAVSTSPFGGDHLLIGDQLLWFGALLPHSSLNPNQFCAFGIDAQDGPFDASRNLGASCDHAFMPFGSHDGGKCALQASSAYRLGDKTFTCYAPY